MSKEACVIHFTVDEVMDMVAAKVRERHPELVGRQFDICAIINGDEEFTGINVNIDASEDAV